MTGDLATGIFAAVWLGILTSISPCPLATNIAAVSFIGKSAAETKTVAVAGTLYLFGRMTAYAALAALIVSSLLSIPTASDFLQRYMNKLLGPVLIIAGMFLLKLVRLPAGSGTDPSGLQRLAGKNLPAASFIMGVVFALAFCPVSAALFFGSLVPLAVRHNSSLLMPSLYGAGTALPVLAFALVAAFGARHLSRAFNAVTAFELWGRRITGILFIGIGVYFCLQHIFGIQII
ncbi:MAG: sulfite exporter TauE/SafE family protein [Spirochaetes bacterium]|nr:sulfite exporter TauE/SafE family protein [Spirochaetota bacterium]